MPREPLSARAIYLREGGGGAAVSTGAAAPALCCPDVVSVDIGVHNAAAGKELVRLLCTTGLPMTKDFTRASDGKVGVIKLDDDEEDGAPQEPMPPPLVITGAQNGYEIDFDVNDTHGDRAIKFHAIFDSGAAMSFLSGGHDSSGDGTWQTIGGTRAARAAWRLRAQDQEKFSKKRSDAVGEMIGWLTGGVRRGKNADDGNNRLLGLGGHRARLRVEINIRHQRYHQAYVMHQAPQMHTQKLTLSLLYSDLSALARSFLRCSFFRQVVSIPFTDSEAEEDGPQAVTRDRVLLGGAKQLWQSMRDPAAYLWSEAPMAWDIEEDIPEAELEH